MCLELRGRALSWPDCIKQPRTDECAHDNGEDTQARIRCPGPEQRGWAVSEFSCVGRAVDPVQAIARVKRSPKRMANCALAMHHSRAGMVHSFSDRFKTRNSSFRAASSVGK